MADAPSSAESIPVVGCHCPPQADHQSLVTDEATSSICTKCRTVERENSKTKSKLDQLRLVMQQKKERREARKLQSAPYTPLPGTAAARLLAASCAATANAQITNAANVAQTPQTASATTETDATSGNTGAAGAAAANSGIIAEVATINNLVEEVDTAA